MSSGGVSVGGGIAVPTAVAITIVDSPKPSNGVVPVGSESAHPILAFTGLEVQYLLGIGAALFIAGLLLVLLTRPVEPLPDRAL